MTASISAQPVAAHPDPDEPLPRRGIIFAVASIALFMASVDQTIVATALSTIQRELHTSIEWAGWTITVYSLGQIVVLPLAGRLSDTFGRKRVFLIAIVLFTGSSLACGLAQNVYVLIALRGVQAIGGGAFLPSVTGIVADHFGRNRDRALGMVTSIFPIGGIVGPILGGLFVEGWSWRGIFFVNVPLGIALLILAAVLIPRSATVAGSRIDVVGVTLLGTTLLGAMLGISFLGDGAAVLSPAFLIPEAVAVVGLVAFLLHTRYAESPFIPMRLLAGRGFGTMNIVNFLYGAAALGFGALVPLYAQERFGISVLGSSTLLSARGIGMIAVAAVAVFALRRTGYRFPMIAGFLVIGAGLLSMSLVPASVSPYVWLSIAGAVTGIGMGFAVPASNNATMQLARENLAGVAGLRAMFRQSGAIMGVSITTAVLAQSHDPGQSLGVAFSVFAVIIVLVTPLVFLVPDHRGSW